jgi:hypothetical protein
MTAAITQPRAISTPPNTIHKRFRTREIGDMVLF